MRKNRCGGRLTGDRAMSERPPWQKCSQKNMSELADASLVGEKVTEIDDRANGVSMFPVAMSVKASDGKVQSAV